MTSVIRCTFLLFTTLALVCECTRICLSCTDLKEGEQCQHIVTCPDNEVCFLEKYTTSNGETRYDVGCADHKMCPAQDLQNTFGKRTSDHSHILCHRCCNNTHICNTDLTCDNLNNSSRQNCYSCSDVDDPSACQTKVTCGINDVCYVHYFRTESTRLLYDLGCKPATMCMKNYKHLFGRRSSEGRHLLCGACCADSNYCNGNMICGNQQKFPRECEDIQSNSCGVYRIYPSSQNHPVYVYCIMEKGKKWTVIQRRINGSVDFFRTWNEYKEGFGSAYGEYWLGNGHIHDMSTYGSHELSIVLVNSTGEKGYANYSKFSVEDEQSNYLLYVTGYSGTISNDAMNSDGNSSPSGGGDKHMFTTKDRDNDQYNGTNCAVSNHGGWWYGMCRYLGINEVYRKGNLYSQFFPSTVSSIMMIRRT
ncbi:uncharacterized protein [Mytilus edulis]|uniref:uncharacterized protein isoform X2 n=1 Tax=Mytilus edulis TaxID=6550 RepID=UPI0039EE47FF